VKFIYSIKSGAVPGVIIFKRLKQPDKGNSTFMFYLFTHGICVGVSGLIL
jgi:hypothetical protein